MAVEQQLNLVQGQKWSFTLEKTQILSWPWYVQQKRPDQGAFLLNQWLSRFRLSTH